MFFKWGIQAEDIALWIKRYFKAIALVFFLAGLIAMAFIAWHKWQENQEKKTQDSLYKLKSDLKALIKDSKTANQNKPLALSREMKDKAKIYEEAIKKSQKSRAGAVFSIDLADFYYQRGAKQKAKDLLSLFAFPEKSSSLYQLVSFQLSSYYMDEGECEKALALLSALRSNKKAVPFHSESDLQQGLCLERLGRYDLALSKYEAVINKDSANYVSRLAEDYKKLLLLKRNLKK